MLEGVRLANPADVNGWYTVPVAVCVAYTGTTCPAALVV